jgi:hypothetical protein
MRWYVNWDYCVKDINMLIGRGVGPKSCNWRVSGDILWNGVLEGPRGTSSGTAELELGMDSWGGCCVWWWTSGAGLGRWLRWRGFYDWHMDDNTKFRIWTRSLKVELNKIKSQYSVQQNALNCF